MESFIFMEIEIFTEIVILIENVIFMNILMFKEIHEFFEFLFDDILPFFFRILQQRIRSKEAEVLHQTYTPEAIKALSKIHHELKEKTIEERKRLDQLKYQLEQYSSLGEDFANLAKKYAEILKDIQDKEWMMKAINDSRE